MPFIKQADSHGSKPPTHARKIFNGRTGEMLFFKHNILKPEEPTHNILSISGQGGVGKSTLLAQFIDEARSTEFKDYCLTAIVDEWQTTPTSIMEKFAKQLHIEGKFEKALRQYKEALRKLQTEPDTLQDTVLQKAPGFVSAAAEGIPFVGPLAREGVKVTAGHLLERYQTAQTGKAKERLDNSIDDLTRAFVSELNLLTDNRVLLSAQRVKRQRHIILFFDTFEHLSIEAGPWLLDHFLQADISNHVVLVVAGRDSIERSTPVDPKRWLSYLDDGIIYSIFLDSFSEEETRDYLAQRGIIELTRIDTIWKLSRGLPLYLSLLTSNPQGNVDPTKDVVDNFLRWISQQEQIKRRLVLDVALFSKPFNRDDLEAFAYLPEHERDSIYDWLIRQPFVRSSLEDGRYSYHELAQELFSRHLYQRSQQAYYATRKVLAHHYERLLKKIQEERSEKLYRSSEWLELALAPVYQWFFLPDEASHSKAVEQVLFIYKHTNKAQDEEIVRVLRKLSEEQFAKQANPNAIRLVKQILRLVETNQNSQETLIATSSLIEELIQKSSFPQALLAPIYSKRGNTYHFFKEYQQAITDFDLALEVDANYTSAYSSRGWTYYWLKEYQRAFIDFNHALELDPRDPYAYCRRGWAYGRLKSYQQAITDFDHAIELDPDFFWAYCGRGCVYHDLKNYQQAIVDFNHALELDPNNDWPYRLRGHTHLWLKDIKQARADYTRSWGLDPSLIQNGWMIKWIDMCLDRPAYSTAEWLETIAAIDPRLYTAYVCRGTAKYLSQHFEEALAELEQAIQLKAEEWSAYFWKGMVCTSISRDNDAITAIEKALKLGLPPVLLAPLCWFEQDRPRFFEEYAKALLARYGQANI